MLKINLLPPYIFEPAKRRRVTAVWIVLFVAVIGACLAWKSQIDAQVNEVKQQTEAERPKMVEKQQKEQEAKKINDESAVVRGKRDFVKSARDYTLKTYPTLVYNVRDYTLQSVVYSSLQSGGQSVTMSAFAPSLAKVGHYVMWMEHNPNISNVSVAINSLYGFPLQRGQSRQQGFGSQQQVASTRPPGHDFVVTLTLSQPLPAGPTYGGIGAGPPQGGGRGFGGGGMPPGGYLGPPSGMMGSGGMGGGVSGPPPGMSSGGAGGGKMMSVEE